MNRMTIHNQKDRPRTAMNLLRQLFDLRIRFLQPFLDSVRFLLISTPKRPLRRQTQLAQQTTHGSFTQLNPKSLMNKLSHHLCRPKRIRMAFQHQLTLASGYTHRGITGKRIWVRYLVL